MFALLLVEKKTYEIGKNLYRGLPVLTSVIQFLEKFKIATFIQKWNKTHQAVLLGYETPVLYTVAL